MQTKLHTNAVMAAAAMALLWSMAAGDAPVADAAMRGDVAEVRSLLQGGADVNTAQGDGMTALHWAAHHGSVEMTRMLLYAGANSEAATRVGAFTPLLVASRAGQAPAVEALLQAGADFRATTSTGETALHFAAAAGSTGSVEALLAAGAEVDARQGMHEQTPLMFAAHQDRAEVVRLLMRNGADPEARATVVDYPAMVKRDEALEKHRMELLKVMSGATKSGTDYSEEEAEEEEEPESDEEDEPEEAAETEEPGAEEEREEEEAKLAAEETADTAVSGGKSERKPLSYTDLVGRQGGLTALHLAARQGSAAAARALLDGGADIDAPTGGDTSTPLLMAVVNGHFDLARELLDRGADPNKANVAGATPLYGVINLQWAPKSWYPQPTSQKAAEIDYLELMEALLEAGADPNARLERDLWFVSFNGATAGVGDTWGATPFWRAAWGTDVEAMKLLVAYGAEPGIPTRRPPVRVRYPRPEKEDEDKSGLPPVPVGGPAIYPIHAATGVGYGEGFAANTHRHVPEGWLAATRYLVEDLGADVNARDYNGYTPLHHAASRGDVELILYLVSRGADVTVVSRRGQSTADMANGPVQRVQPFPEALALLESLGAVNNHNCVSC